MGDEEKKVEFFFKKIKNFFSQNWLVEPKKIWNQSLFLISPKRSIKHFILGKIQFSAYKKIKTHQMAFLFAKLG